MLLKKLYPNTLKTWFLTVSDLPLNSSPSASLNLFKLGCFGASKAWLKSKAPPSQIPKFSICLGISWILICSSLVAEEKKTDRDEIAKISEAMGHLIGKNLQSLGVSFDLDAIVRGLHEEALGKKSPLTDEECLLVIAEIQEDSQSKIADKNLQDAESFLAKNKQKDSIISLKEGKIQYEVMKLGEGPSVESYGSPLVRYSGHYLDGSSIPEAEELIDLDNAISGFKEILIGMKAGEKRIAYIHPDCGYGSRSHIHPNVLLVFEIEVVKPDASLEAHTASMHLDANSSTTEFLDEAALPIQQETVSQDQSL